MPLEGVVESHVFAQLMDAGVGWCFVCRLLLLVGG